MKVLLDTCVVSELTRPKANSAVRDAVMALAEEDVFLSVITIGEIVNGIARLPPGQKKTALETWLGGLERDYAARILPIDGETARIWGTLTAAARRAGRAVAVADGLIAATARAHGLHVMTRNVSDFAPTGVLIVNPWA